MAQTKAELVEELEAQATKADLVELLRSKLLKDDLAKLLEDESGATKEELVHKLESLKKDELVEAVASHVNKDDIEKVVAENREDDETESEDEADEEDTSEDEGEEEPQADADREDDTQDEDEAEQDPGERHQPARFESHEPAWPAQQPPFSAGQRVRVDLSGLPMMGIYAGRGASAAGTIVDIDAGERLVQVYLDAVFDGEKEIVVPPERVAHEG